MDLLYPATHLYLKQDMVSTSTFDHKIITIQLVKYLHLFRIIQFTFLYLKDIKPNHKLKSLLCRDMLI